VGRGVAATTAVTATVAAAAAAVKFPYTIIHKNSSDPAQDEPINQ
jgi:hypothetical protein